MLSSRRHRLGGEFEQGGCLLGVTCAGSGYVNGINLRKCRRLTAGGATRQVSFDEKCQNFHTAKRGLYRWRRIRGAAGDGPGLWNACDEPKHGGATGSEENGATMRVGVLSGVRGWCVWSGGRGGEMEMGERLAHSRGGWCGGDVGAEVVLRRRRRRWEMAVGGDVRTSYPSSRCGLPSSRWEVCAPWVIAVRVQKRK